MKFLTAMLFFSSVAIAQPEVILAPVEHLYVPTGFDSNDSVEVVVTGNFPNTCYSRNKVEVKVRDAIIDIKVTSLAPEGSLITGRACPEMLVPFKEVVGVGNLQGGEYEIRVNADSVTSLGKKLSIA